LTENHDTSANISVNVKTEYLLTKKKHRRDHIDYLNVAASTTDIHINNYDE
jgi:Uri superfamily endonuclease